jgi:hypothetical protein
MNTIPTPSRRLFAATGLALALLAAGPAQAQQGVSRNEIVLGTIQDLSGPIAGFGKQTRLGMMLRVDEVNEQGGIHGRRVKLQVEDSGYDPRRKSWSTKTRFLPWWATWAPHRTWPPCRCSLRKTSSTSCR